MLAVTAMQASAQKKATIPVEQGVSKQLAEFRASVLNDVTYALDFNIPGNKSEAIKASALISFKLDVAAQPLQLDFQQRADQVQSVTINSKKAPVELLNEHLLLPGKYLQKGINQVQLEFAVGSQSLNRNDDYLYALFVPDHARTAFPCFDQPDIKARYQLTLRVPQGWQVLANGLKKDSVATGNKSIYRFAQTDKLSTYLFSFTAGKYSRKVASLNGREAEFLYRETDTAKIRMSVDSVFEIHKNAISFLEDYTGIKYPFQKVGFVAIPDFQFGGMEHPGEVQYKASALFLDSGATRDQYISRINLISHETAHMWFGDLVTMRWFNDVWMKEVFANFMADKVTERLMGRETFALKFLQDHYPAAYGIDRTQGANPIRQQLDNMNEAGSMYGNIIYHKAPIMMRQLEQLMGAENFRKGLHDYLQKYAYGNATWPDLIAALSKYTTADLQSWNKVWVNQPGRPVFTYEVQYSGNRISNFFIIQKPEFGDVRLWPQVFTVALVYADSVREVPVNMTGGEVAVNAFKGAGKPLYILFNADGMGYGMFPVDVQMNDHLFRLQSPLRRASAYITLYENMLSGRYVKPDQLLAIFQSVLQSEQNEMNLRQLTGYISSIYWEFISPAKRNTFASGLEAAIWQAMEQQSSPNNKKVLFKAYQDIALNASANANLYNVWASQQAPAGVKLTEDDYTSLALTIALKSDTATQVLPQQLTRIKNEDRKKRLIFLVPALSTDKAVRNEFFQSLKLKQNRTKEAWVLSALYYLHHPLRQQTSAAYLPESLNMLEEIWHTGDIFFPQSWLAATFGSYQTAYAEGVVDAFLKAHPQYNAKLRDKILQATDNLKRARKLAD